MQGTDTLYYRRRLYVEMTRAVEAASPAARKAHGELAELYRARLAALGPIKVRLVDTGERAEPARAIGVAMPQG